MEGARAVDRVRPGAATRRSRSGRRTPLDVLSKLPEARYNHPDPAAYPPISRLNSVPREGVGRMILG